MFSSEKFVAVSITLSITLRKCRSLPSAITHQSCKCRIYSHKNKLSTVVPNSIAYWSDSVTVVEFIGSNRSQKLTAAFFAVSGSD
jgi:hypothetical protein